MKTLLGCVAATGLMASASFAGSWTSVADESVVSFGSVKKDVVGEVHSFESVSATVAEDGALSMEIDLTSVETYIDIRNERMGEHVFKGAATATLTGQVDMEDVSALSVGETTIVDMEGTLSLLGTDAPVEAELFVARLAEDRVLVTTAGMLMLSTADLGIDGGIDKLMELAKLPGITRVSPVTIRMVFAK